VLIDLDAAHLQHVTELGRVNHVRLQQQHVGLARYRVHLPLLELLGNSSANAAAVAGDDGTIRLTSIGEPVAGLQACHEHLDEGGACGAAAGAVSDAGRLAAPGHAAWRPVPGAGLEGRTRPRHREDQRAIHTEKNKSSVLAGRAGLRDAGDGQARGPGWVGRGRCGIPSTSTRAITPRTEGKPGMVVGERWLIFPTMLPSVRGVIGLRQVDGMPHQAPSLRDARGDRRSIKRHPSAVAKGGRRRH
jgi:hypothetical protein